MITKNRKFKGFLFFIYNLSKRPKKKPSVSGFGLGRRSDVVSER